MIASSTIEYEMHANLYFSEAFLKCVYIEKISIEFPKISELYISNFAGNLQNRLNWLPISTLIIWWKIQKKNLPFPDLLTIWRSFGNFFLKENNTKNGKMHLCAFCINYWPTSSWKWVFLIHNFYLSSYNLLSCTFYIRFYICLSACYFYRPIHSAQWEKVVLFCRCIQQITIKIVFYRVRQNR